MCIVFLAISSQPKKDGYKVIIANNRDEYFNRPARQAHFWEDHPHILSGTDLFSGREGGTWIGITKTGKIGILTNYRQAPSFCSPEAKPRGGLVPCFLKSDEEPGTYIDKIKQTGKSYNGFNLIVGQVSTKVSSKFSYYCNQEHEPTEDMKAGVYGLSNRYLDYGWKKITLGKERFTNIIQMRCSVNDKISLLLELLQDKTRYPDDELFTGPQDVDLPKCYLEALTAISVFISADPVCYGTRTNTIIIVDDEDNVTYVERTMEEPINHLDDINWKTNKFSFKIHF